jgi:hypothetical protein
MGFLGKLFGQGEAHPPLDAGSPAGQAIASHQKELEEIANKVRDPLEAVPGDRALYVFIGRPPDRFGIVWFHEGREDNLKNLMKTRGLAQREVQALSDAVRRAYVAAQGDPRFTHRAADKEITVRHSPALAEALAGILHRVEV